MKNPLLPDPDTHPMLYAREYLKLRPVIDWLALVAAFIVGVPVAGVIALWAFRLVFAL